MGAADVTVGSTFDVKSSEQFMMYFFDELTAGIPNTNDVDAKMCATWVSANANNLKIVFEYDGEFSTPTDMCVSATSFTTDALLATGLNSLAGVANGLVVVVGQDIRGAATDAAGSDSQPTPSDDSFNKYFPWGLTATGAAHGMITVTLPLGLDGSKFRMHLQTVNGIQLGLASTGKAGQVYVHRARNNNGRTFEVTQAYENKVAGMTHFSKANAATAADGTAAAALDTLGSVMGSLTIGSVTAPTSGFNPGTYYNVKISQDSGTATPKGGGFGIYAKVVVSIGGISHVEVTAGGYAAKASDVYTIKCDTRIHTAFTDCNAGAAGATRQDVTIKAGTNGAADLQNIALVGLRVGAIGPATETVTDLCAAGEIQRRFANTATAAATSGMLLSVQLLWRCSKANADGAAAVATDLTDVVVLAPGAPNGAATFSKVTELEHVNKLILKLKAAADTVATFEKADINTFYYQAGFYDTVTPQFNQDSLHASSLDGEDVQESEMMAVMGGRQANGGYLYTSHVGGDMQQLFGGLKDVASRGHGNGRRTKGPTLTASLMVGSQGVGATVGVTIAATFSEHMDKYAYVGRGFDQLTVTPTPDAMDSMKLEVTYHGAAGACSVTEVDRGTHESSVCSGRGNCDFSTGTCLCDAGYTLEACSEQTVLV